MKIFSVMVVRILFLLLLGGCVITPEVSLKGQSTPNETRISSIKKVPVDLGEGSRVIYVPVPLSLPEKPVVPRIPGRALVCLDQGTLAVLKQRDRVLKDYIERLEAVIRSTSDNDP